MANKGTFEGKTLLSPQTWEEMHLNPTDGILVQKSVKVYRKYFHLRKLLYNFILHFTTFKLYSSLIHNINISFQFTQGGVAKFEEEGSGDSCCGRNGFYGWMGFGGSVFQWHPELKIGLENKID